ncbi:MULTISPECIES: hypothetical protein [unclassified Brenneria]|uniref:hypothetical protein n=1 Tax=unclassified Brenneria TaxID=2634434 RepID=UPI0018F068FD|nr:hypothetical protein [Brenneria sp. L3-3C-1]MBJ7222519.1 hypothetical protein [Brenneria sp. L3-3C-1]MEE3643762.1 hypothetical protein [Brenneria sp. L3_3C_1]
MEFNIWKIKFSISRNSKNDLAPDKLLYDRKYLKSFLRPYFDNKSANIGILLSQISILVTIGYTMLVSDISSKWGIDKGIWMFLSIFVFSSLIIWFIYIVYKILVTPSYEKFLQVLAGQSTTRDERRFAFLILAIDKDDSLRLLVEYSKIWDCWLLPNFGKSRSADFDSTDKLSSALADKWGASSEDITVTPVNDDLISTKISYKSNSLTTYYFDIFFVKISEKLSRKMLTMDLTLPGGKYSWKTIGELKEDNRTFERNLDVIEHVEQRIFANGRPGISIPHHLELNNEAID